MIRRQSNGVDCGLWVLANIVAVLHGYHATGVDESQMTDVRRLLLEHIIALPYRI